ncbi:hypothetical protein [Candidatus Halobonum tyrrellensis]|uniref:Uncharacterized protein n=1 Tax=Candidatus Halobonum tyrrellensis G22 TaxID=1324957 RepID=V4J0K8_9EURY|nr:hypothetical protein [Candidatus Halobonum tyrrellensis]ESP89002.1 hypothetical protein K933_06118 [Candidatus Halobonum tyrrellensis G22]
MNRRRSLARAFRGLSVVAVSALTVVLVALLPAPGSRPSRLLLFGLVALFGWVGAAGAVRSRVRLLTAGAVGLFLLGFWQFTVGWVVLPTSLVLLVTAALVLLDGPPEGRERPPA